MLVGSWLNAGVFRSCWVWSPGSLIINVLVDQQFHLRTGLGLSSGPDHLLLLSGGFQGIEQVETTGHTVKGGRGAQEYKKNTTKGQPVADDDHLDLWQETEPYSTV